MTNAKFYPLTVSDIHRQTDDSVAITFHLPGHLEPTFQYKQGQYVTVQLEVNGVRHRRPYSLCSSPYTGDPLSIAVRRTSDEGVSAYLTDQLAPGDTLELYPPMGNFTRDLNADHNNHYVLIAAGSGITPVLSILKSILTVEPNSRATLLYANRSYQAIMFRDIIQQFQTTHGDRCRVVNILEQKGPEEFTHHVGRLDDANMEDLIRRVVGENEVAQYFVSGAQIVIDIAISTLYRLGVDDGRIHREYPADVVLSESETEPAPLHKEVTLAPSALQRRTVEIRLYGDSFSFDVEPDESLLAAALRANADPPFACQIGACCTCRARLISGEVIMDEREGLSDQEVEEGYILTCQSHPVTDGVVADYDQ